MVRDDESYNRISEIYQGAMTCYAIQCGISFIFRCRSCSHLKIFSHFTDVGPSFFAERSMFPPSHQSPFLCYIPSSSSCLVALLVLHHIETHIYHTPNRIHYGRGRQQFSKCPGRLYGKGRIVHTV